MLSHLGSRIIYKLIIAVCSKGPNPINVRSFFNSVILFFKKLLCRRITYAWSLRQSRQYGESFIPKEEGREMICMLLVFITFHGSTNTSLPFKTIFSMSFFFPHSIKSMLSENIILFWYSLMTFTLQSS